MNCRYVYLKDLKEIVDGKLHCHFLAAHGIVWSFDELKKCNLSVNFKLKRVFNFVCAVAKLYM